MSAKQPEPVPLDRDSRVLTLARAAFGQAIAQVLDHSSAAASGRDPEALHQLRVGLRRLRVLLRVFRSRLDEPTWRALEGELRSSFQLLGALREYDVLLAEVVEPLRARQRDPSFDALERALARERLRAARSVRERLRGPQFKALLKRLRALVRELEQAEGETPRARKWARKRLDKQLGVVLARRAAALGKDDDARHDLRKKLKRLRYTADVMRGVWPEKQVKRFAKQLGALQDALGGLTDVAFATTLLLRAKKRLGERAEPAFGRCLRRLERSAEKHRRALEPALEELVDARPFWA